MSNEEEKTLVESAEEIINLPDHVPEDITELQRIRRKMVRVYKSTSEKAASTEELYEHSRAERYLEIKAWEKRPDGKSYTDRDAEMAAKLEAEKKYWHHRLLKAKSQGMRATIDAVQAFCMDYYTKAKNERDAAMVTEEHR